MAGLGKSVGRFFIIAKAQRLFGYYCPYFRINRIPTFHFNIVICRIILNGDITFPFFTAHLLYFVTKNHSFFDGNKRIAAAMFLYFLDKNGALFANGQKTIDDHTLVALTIMIAESQNTANAPLSLPMSDKLPCPQKTDKCFQYCL